VREVGENCQPPHHRLRDLTDALAWAAPCSGFKRQAGMEALLDGAEVGVGSTLGIHTWSIRLEIQCCRRRPGTGRLIQTGLKHSSVMESVMIVRDRLSRSIGAVGERPQMPEGWGEGGVTPTGTDLHVHVEYGGLEAKG
jgi:hypothetical protein